MKTFPELIRSYFVFLLISSPIIAKNNELLMKVGLKVLGTKLFGILMKMTFYGHFVIGENAEVMKPKLDKLNKYGVGAILDYGVEEDLSKEEAENKEMKASVSAVKDEKPDAKVAEDEELGGKLPQYKPSKEFADRRNGVASARTYFYESEELCERNVQYFIESIEAVSGKEVPFIAVKLTSLGRPQLLYQLSEVIMRARAFTAQITGQVAPVSIQHLSMPDLEKRLKEAGVKDVESFMKHVEHEGKEVIHLFPWSGIINEKKELDKQFTIPSLKHKQMVRLITKLTKDEEEMFINMIHRMNRIIMAAEKCNVHIMIDAEHSYFQPAISRITIEFMHRYNQKKAIIFNTYQAYLKNAYTEMSSDLYQSMKQNFHFGFKLVRGAYVDHERERAQMLNYPDPINETYEKTTEMYTKIVEHTMKQIGENKRSDEIKKLMICIASHNEDSTMHAVQQMKENDIRKEDKVVFFAQLLGMSDFITFPLGNAGYSAYKYMPYGPVDKVIPYLARRAKENLSVLQKLNKEKTMLRQEIIRRLRTGQIFNKT